MEEKRAFLKKILHHDHPDPRTLDLTYKVKLIEMIKEATSDDPEQGSKEWAEGRQIGGSEAAIMLGSTVYGKTAYDVIKDKIFPGGFFGNLATKFGQTFEEVGRLVVQVIFRHKVWELKSLPNKLKHTTYSPDGLTIAYLFKRFMLLLLEFKMPLSRIPDGKIPKDYIPQIKAGMCAIPFVDGALFVDTMLRVCKLNQLNYNFEYNLRLHKQDTTTAKAKHRQICAKDKLDMVCGFGMVVLYQNDLCRSNVTEHYEDFLNDEKITSFGGESIVVFQTGPTFEEELLKPKPCRDNHHRIRYRNSFYEYLFSQGKIPTNILFDNKNTVEGFHKLNESELFCRALLNINETDFGDEIANNYEKMFEIIHEKKFIQTKYLDPYLVYKNVEKLPVFKSNDFPTSEYENYEESVINSHIHFLQEMDALRIAWEETDNKIVGVIPYKIFNLQMIFTENKEPKFMDAMQPILDIYDNIKKEIADIKIDDEIEKNKAKYDVLFKYFPDKKPLEIAEQSSVDEALLKMALDDDGLF